MAFQRRKTGDLTLNLLERSLSRLSSFSLDDRSVETLDQINGPYGLSLLYAPPLPLLELIFVHGLRGGSRKTWSKSKDPLSFWPKEWLPRDPEFKNARIFSFGYNSDWWEREESVLSLYDFGNYLLSEMMNSPDIRRDGDTPVIFIGHSMGGLVIKQTYVLATRDPSARSMADRVRAMVFLATPHRGADVASTLSNVLKASFSHGEKPFVTDLKRNSIAITSINDEFRHYSQKLELLSFYETLKTNIGLSSTIIVSKDSAILGYHNERAVLLNATHRTICKFDSPLDPNYISLRNSLSTLIRTIMQQEMATKRDQRRAERLQLQEYLGVSEIPDDDLGTFEAVKLRGSCEWFTWKEHFQEWRDSQPGSLPYFWLSGPQAAGKSVMAAHVIQDLQAINLDCSYFFFKHNDKTKTSLSGCLRSLAYQMALTDLRVLRRLLILKEESVNWDRNNETSIWRKLFLRGIFEVSLDRPHFWVIDGMDESTSSVNIMSLLHNDCNGFPVRVFITSRPTSDIVRAVSHLKRKIYVHQMTAEDTRNDIQLYLESHIKELPLVDDLSRFRVAETIMEKSGSSFLWVALVLEELRSAFSETDIQDILNDVPAGMDPLYKRALGLMSQANRGKQVIKAILAWTVCAIRPLTLEELKTALQLDLGESVLALDEFISSNCWQFVQVDMGRKVSLIHETARAFLLREDLESEFAVNKANAHSRIADICLQYLCSDEMKPPRSQKLLLVHRKKVLKRSAMAKYACTYFGQHLRRSRAEDNQRFLALCKFLSGNVSAWIEHIASTGNLQYLVQMAQDMKGFTQARARHFSPLGSQVKLVETWASDLIRLVSQFGKHLTESPWVIFWLIPPFCPPMTAIGSQSEFASSHGIVVKGISSLDWSDRVSCIQFRDLQTRAVACTTSTFAVGLSDKSVSTYSRSTCQQVQSLKCSQPAKLIAYSSCGRLLACSSLHFLTLFNLNTSERVWEVRLPHECVALLFADQDIKLWIVTKGGILSAFSVADGSRLKTILLIDPSDKDTASPFRRVFTAAAISLEMNMVAAVQRGRPISVYDITEGVFLGACEREQEETEFQREDAALLWIREFLFSPDPDANSLAAIYHDGHLVVFDPCEMSPKITIQANAQILACSPNGNFLATGNDSGTIQLFEFETLTLIYKIVASDHSIRSLAFSSDSLRFLDIRGSQCNVWEPSVLVQENRRENDSVSDIVARAVTVVGIVGDENVAEITAVACHCNGEYIFCGKDNGAVALYSAKTGREIQVLYKHGQGTGINFLTFDANSDLLVSADASSRYMVWRCTKQTDLFLAEGPLLDARTSDYSITQILVDSLNKRLLVSTIVSDAVHDIKNGQQQSWTFAQRDSWKWINHPRDPSKLIHISAKSVHIHTWDNLSEPCFRADMKTASDMTPDMLVKRVCSSSNGGKISIEFAKHNSLQSTSTVLFLATDALSEPVDSEILSLPQFTKVSAKIEHIISSSDRRLLFLDQQMWVCSLDLEKFTGEYYRHFFIPEEWLSVNRGLILKLTPKLDLVFVKRDEVAIIQNGLEYKETRVV